MAISNSVAVLALQEVKMEFWMELFWCGLYMVENYNSNCRDHRYKQKAEAAEWLRAEGFPEVEARLLLTSESDVTGLVMTNEVMFLTQVAGRRCLVNTMSCNL